MEFTRIKNEERSEIHIGSSTVEVRSYPFSL